MAREVQGRMAGTVKRLVEGKGFGFILCEDGLEYFFHSSASPDFNQLSEGDAVTFEKGRGNRGPRAESVQVVT